MTALEAQQYIEKLEKYVPPTKEDLEKVEHIKVDYNNLNEMPKYVQKKINFALDYILKKYNPKKIDLCRSYVDGYPIDEETSQKDFELLKKIKKVKLSDFDFIVHGALDDKWSVVETISPLIKIDLFNYYHNNIKIINLYGKETM